MTVGPGSAIDASTTDAMHIAGSAVVIGTASLGHGVLLAQGTVVRSWQESVVIDSGSAVLENSVAVGNPVIPTNIGRRTVFGHRCLIVGATVGNLCEIGNASILMPGAVIGDRVFLGEGTLVPSGMALPNDVVAVGRPARIVRAANEDDYARLVELRGGDLVLPASSTTKIDSRQEALPMGQLYEYRGIVPTVAETATIFATAEITGDVVVGERTVIGAGVKIIGDSHGPVRIGNDVQILENTVLHLLPHNDLVIGDGVIVGPGTMIHGCRIGAGSIVEPGAIVSDFSTLGEECVVRAGAVIKQRSVFPARSDIDGFPAVTVSRLPGTPERPDWALSSDDLPTPIGRSNQ
jgi:carbonic anhydrase/acetyltransferase-like protein (isoleucine patch superfamily)